MNSIDDSPLILVGHDILDLDAMEWLGALSNYQPIWISEGSPLFLISHDMELCAIDVSQQVELWRRELQGQIKLVAMGMDSIAVATRDEVWHYDKVDGVGREIAWFEEVEIEAMAHIGQHVVVALSDSSIRSYNLVSGAMCANILPFPTDSPDVEASLRPIGREVPVREQDTVLLPTQRMTFCVITELEYHYDVRCYDPWGQLIWHTPLEHTSIDWVDGVARVVEKRLGLTALGSTWALFSPVGPGEVSHLLEFADGANTQIEGGVDGVVQDEEGHPLALVSLDPGGASVRLSDPATGGGIERWMMDIAPCTSVASCPIMGATGVVLALFHPFQRDVIVLAGDLRTGALLWKARFEMPETPYRMRHELNTVEVSEQGECVVVRCFMSPSVTARIFETSSGRCIFPRTDASASDVFE